MENLSGLIYREDRHFYPGNSYERMTEWARWTSTPWKPDSESHWPGFALREADVL